MPYIFVVFIIIFVLLFLIPFVVRTIKAKKEEKQEEYEKVEEKSEVSELDSARVKDYKAQQTAVQGKTKIPASAVQTQTPAHRTMQPTIIMPTVGVSKNIAEMVKKADSRVSVTTEKTTPKAAHAHPTEDGYAYVVEKVDMGGSLGGESTEGCAEHYFERFHKINDTEEVQEEPNYELIKTIVFGEALGKAKFHK